MWIECVPNFSEGRDAGAVSRLAASIASVTGVHLLHTTSDSDHNRSVMTFAGNPSEVRAAALEAAAAAIREIDITRHSGVHPRIGAMDVLPFVPLAGGRLEECAELAVEAGHQLWSRFALPVFLYEAASQGKGLEVVRKAAFAGAPPDIGTGRHPTAGAVVVGARPFLIAWNIHLHSTDLALAQRLARAIRYSSGGFPGVKALGLPLESLGRVQVSINSTDFERTPLHLIFQRVAELAETNGVEVAGSELIGLIPQRAVDLSAGHNLHWFHMESALILENALQLK